MPSQSALLWQSALFVKFRPPRVPSAICAAKVLEGCSASYILVYLSTVSAARGKMSSPFAGGRASGRGTGSPGGNPAPAIVRQPASFIVRQQTRNVRLDISHGQSDSWRQRQTAKSVRLPGGTRPVFVFHANTNEWSTVDGYSKPESPMINAEPLAALDAGLAAFATCPATIQPVRIFNENNLEIKRADVAQMEFPELADLAVEAEPEPPSEAAVLEIALRSELAAMSERVVSLESQVSQLFAMSKSRGKRTIDDDN